MIIECKNEVLLLQGALHKNEWLNIKALARLQLQQFPQGIIIDCSGLTDISEDGAKTFLQAMRDIQGEGARIVVVSLPDNILQVIRSVPGVRSQLPIANSIEEARASLLRTRTSSAADAECPVDGNSILIPVREGLDIDFALLMASRSARELRVPITLVYLLIVNRSRPLASPLPEEEAEAHRLLDLAEQTARKLGVPVSRHVERVRDAEEGLLQLVKNYKASKIIVGAYPDRLEEEAFVELVDVLLHRAPCDVIIARQAPDVQHPLPLGGAHVAGRLADE